MLAKLPFAYTALCRTWLAIWTIYESKLRNDANSTHSSAHGSTYRVYVTRQARCNSSSATHVNHVVGPAPGPVCGRCLGVASPHEQRLWRQVVDGLQLCILQLQLDLELVFAVC